MKAVVIRRSGGQEFFELQELPTPQVEDDEVLIKVAATAIDKGNYILDTGHLPRPDLPNGAYSLMGNECSGHVIAVGQNVTRWNIGDRVCALLDGGGYFEEVAVKAGHVLPAPSEISLVQAAGLPMAACTVWLAIFRLGYLSEKDTLLIHDNSSIIEVLALQVAKHIGARVFIATETKKRKDFYKSLGADLCIDYVKEDLVAKVRKETKSHGVDVILDVEASNLHEYCKILSYGGVLAVLHLNGSPMVEMHIPYLMVNNARVKVFDRVALLEDKTFLVRQAERYIWPAIQMGVKLFEHKILPLSKTAEAHQLTNKDIHKVLLSTNESDQTTSEPSQIGEAGKGFWYKVPLVKKILKHRISEKLGKRKA